MACNLKKPFILEHLPEREGAPFLYVLLLKTDAQIFSGIENANYKIC